MTTNPPTSGRRGIAIATAVVGGIALLGLGASAAFAMAGSSQRADAQTTQASALAPVDATGITGLDLNVGVADLRLEYGSVTEATLTATGGSAERWQFGREGDELVVRAPNANSGFCFFGVCPSTRGQQVTATLTLPRAFAAQPLDADITIGVGSVSADGTFGEIDVQVDAGDAYISGTATDLDLVIGMGTFEGEITDAATVDAEVSLGDLALVLRGTPPTDVALEVSAGSIDLAVPAAEYEVVSSRSAGTIENSLRMAADAQHRITAKVDLGDIVLHETP